MNRLTTCPHHTLLTLLTLLTLQLPQVPATALAQPPAAAGGQPPAAARYALLPLDVRFTKPVAMVRDPDDARRLLVAELDGIVIDTRDWVARDEPFLALGGRVTALQGEQGFFSLALEPSSVADALGRERFAFAAYTEKGSGDLVVTRYPIDPASGRARADEELVILRVVMPEPFHHGGQVAFGPDGMLYVGVGDGESSNHFLHEPPFTAPSLDTLRGKLLRLDVSGGWREPTGYRVPPDNPYVGHDRARPEVYASGLRNPWKFHFDRATGDLYVSDVGNDHYEEIDVVRAGDDLGWPSREGPECQWLPDSDGLVDPDCAERTFTEPLVSYGHLALDPLGGQAVTGGVVVTDPNLPGLEGAYVYGDFVTGRVWAVRAYAPTGERLGNASAESLLLGMPGITSFAHGPNGELVVATISGSVARIVPVADATAPGQ